MTVEAWLPVGYQLPDGERTRQAILGESDWQIVETSSGARALLARQALAERWVAAGLIGETTDGEFDFGDQKLHEIACSRAQVLTPIPDGRSPNTKAEALAFAQALRATRTIDAESPLQDAIYIEKISRLLPTYSITVRAADDVLLGYWLTGGANVSVRSFRQLRQALSWLSAEHLREIVEAAGFSVAEGSSSERTARATSDPAGRSSPEGGSGDGQGSVDASKGVFQLPGRPELEQFFNEHVVDIIQNRDRYRAMGIGFPSAIVLHGPPGCGKTFAVEQLVAFLGWPSFHIEAASVASPYIHETSKKVAAVFDKAIQNAPSVLVIDEMEAFLADRESGSGHHRVEEVAEFLRRIPEAIAKEVLILAMTNRVEMIDSAILRRGRFDHMVKVDYASEGEVSALLNKLLSSLPREDDVDAAPVAKSLAGRPLSDVTFVVREGARRAARDGRRKLSQVDLLESLRQAPAVDPALGTSRRIGFI